METNIGSDIRLQDDFGGGALLRNSEEWNFVEFLLQICCRTSRVKLLHAWRLASPLLIHNFEKRTQNRLVIQAFVNANNFSHKSALQDISRRGLQVPREGMRFSVGNFTLPGFPLMVGPEDAPQKKGISQSVAWTDGKERKNALLDEAYAARFSLSGERQVFEYLLCRLGVGHSIVRREEQQALNPLLPQEYDSVYIDKAAAASSDHLTLHFRSPSPHQLSTDSSTFSNEEIVKNKEEDGDQPFLTAGVLPQYTYQHEYILYDSSQILPQYFLIFEMDPAVEELFSIPLCDSCLDRPACIWCASDAARLCVNCDKLIHQQNKVTSRHIRVPLNEMRRRWKNCQLHPNEILELFCSICYFPICQLCRPSHLHASTPADSSTASENLLPLMKPYRAALQLTKQPHFLLQARREDLRSRLNLLQKILEDVRKNAREAEERCYSILETAVGELQRKTEKKMVLVSARQQELLRQLRSITWTESFLSYLRHVLPPADLLSAWLRHCRLRDDLKNCAVGPDAPAATAARLIFADLRLGGTVSILTDSALRRREEERIQQR